MKLLILILLIPILAFGQSNSNFDELIDKTNYYFKQYSKLEEHSNKLPISSFGLSKLEIQEIINSVDDDYSLSPNKDSVDVYLMTTFFQEKIKNQINQLVKQPDFKNKIIRNLIKYEEFSFSKSDDNKLYNFSFDGKSGGSYRSRISLTFFSDFVPKDSTQLAHFESIFPSDGFYINTIKTAEGTKYLLSSFVRSCFLCFWSSIKLVSFKNNKFKEEFNYTIENRDPNDGITYNHKLKTISVNYNIDDLTPYCLCSNIVDREKDDYSPIADTDVAINCKCKFKFNGSTFKLISQSSKKVKIK